MRNLFRCILVSVCLVCVLAVVPAAAQDAAPTVEPTPDSAATQSAIPIAIATARPTARQTLTAGTATVELYFDFIKQGGAGLMYVTGEGVTGATASWLGRLIPFFAAGDGFYGFLSANIEQTSKEYDLEVFVDTAGGSQSAAAKVKIDLGGFIRADFIVPSDRVWLIDPEVERAEFARLSAVIAKPDPAPAWDATGFAPPVPGALSSTFGELRLLNGTVETRHTGWDMQAATGTPILASAAGRVAFAGPMDIRGNYVMVDHGAGVFSGYAHMSQIYVTRGEIVAKGQVLGLSGNTGRSSGPHVHWEMNVNGDWVDAPNFTRMWVP